ncbi:MAG: hypothetical protein ACP5RI_01565 [Candidatus Micrarchaeia archaeon]
MLLQPGRVCIKKLGRDARSKAIITSVEKDGFVKIITSERQKERRCNPAHLEILNEIIDINNKKEIETVLGIQAKEQKKSKTENKK